MQASSWSSALASSRRMTARRDGRLSLVMRRNRTPCRAGTRPSATRSIFAPTPSGQLVISRQCPILRDIPARSRPIVARLDRMASQEDGIDGAIFCDARESTSSMHSRKRACEAARAARKTIYYTFPLPVPQRKPLPGQPECTPGPGVQSERFAFATKGVCRPAEHDSWIWSSISNLEVDVPGSAETCVKIWSCTTNATSRPSKPISM